AVGWITPMLILSVPDFLQVCLQQVHQFHFLGRPCRTIVSDLNDGAFALGLHYPHERRRGILIARRLTVWSAFNSVVRMGAVVVWAAGVVLHLVWRPV